MKELKISNEDMWQEKKSVNPSGMSAFFSNAVKNYAGIDGIENLLENEFITNKKLQRDLAAMDLKEAVFGFNKDTISGHR